jgi:hypothetical protein
MKFLTSLFGGGRQKQGISPTAKPFAPLSSIPLAAQIVGTMFEKKENEQRQAQAAQSLGEAQAQRPELLSDERARTEKERAQQVAIRQGEAARDAAIYQQQRARGASPNRKRNPRVRTGGLGVAGSEETNNADLGQGKSLLGL